MKSPSARRNVVPLKKDVLLEELLFGLTLRRFLIHKIPRGDGWLMGAGFLGKETGIGQTKHLQKRWEVVPGVHM